LNSFLASIGLPATYVYEWDAFYVKKKETYIKWDLVVEAYEEHCRKLLKIK
jgi:hypothetical protein